MSDADADADLLPLSAYSSLISLFTPFVTPPPPVGPVAAIALEKALTYLWHEQDSDWPHNNPNHNYGYDKNPHIVISHRISLKVGVFPSLLTVRDLETPLSETAYDNVETVIRYLATKKAPITPVSRIQPIAELLLLPAASLPQLQKVSLWRGDITTLGVTAIVNAANRRMLGCFKPGHMCIDNVIHAAAGPRLREDCRTIMDAQGFLEPTGAVKVTRGYNLPAKYVLHTVGPKIPPRPAGEPKVEDFEQAELAGCYRSCLKAMEELPDEAGGKTIAFCCISTGLFGYPADEAVQVAVDTVLEYFECNPSSSVAQVVFNVFTPTDLALYIQKFNSLIAAPSPLSVSNFTISPPGALATAARTTVPLAANWLASAGALLITAGTGLSASDGLDYSDLFGARFPGMQRRGFSHIHDLFAFDSWRSPHDKWGHYFSLLLFARSWSPPNGTASSVYTKLKLLVDHHTGAATATAEGKPYFIRTSNTDCLFERTGFPRSHISTPEGSYELLQCLSKCRSDAVFPAQPYLDAALPHLDAAACVLAPEAAVPTCLYCGAPLTPCVSRGDYFNDAPFVDANARYEEFLAAAGAARGHGGGGLVVLEIGAGLKAFEAIRWPDEELVRSGGGRVKFVRVGMGGDEMVDWEAEGVDAVGIEGDAGAVVAALLEEMGITGAGWIDG